VANSRRSKQAPDTEAGPEDKTAIPEATDPQDSTDQAAAPETPAEDSPQADEQPAAAGSQDAAGPEETAGSAASDATESPAQDDATDPAEAQESAPVAPPPAPPRRRGGFLGTVLGGIVAAVIGFGAAHYIGPEGWPFDTGPDVSGTLQALDQRIGDLNTRIQDLETSMTEVQARDPMPAATEELAARIDSVRNDLGSRIDTLAGEIGALSTRVDEIGTRLGDIDARLTAVEKRPIAQADSTEISAAVAAYEKQLEAMRNELAAQRARNSDLADQVAATARSATTEIANAVEQARALQQRAALMRVRAALESGSGFAAALETLEGVEVPAALRSVADTGVPTLDALRQGFEGPAREALAAARRETAAGDTGDRLIAFLRTQLGARSLTPREGNTPDAILSRAEAALRDGRLPAALDEIATLPPAGQDAMADWVARAERRLKALDAVEALAASVNSN